MELKYTETGTPYIDLDEYGILMFSQLTYNREKGYGWMNYSNNTEEIVQLKKKQNGETVRKEMTVNHRISYPLNMYFKRKGGKVGVMNGTIPRKLADVLAELFQEFITDNGYFPSQKLNILQERLEKISVNKILKPVTKRKKRVKKANVQKGKKGRKAKKEKV